MERLALDTCDIGRSFQDVVDDVIATWGAIDHQLGVRGHKSVGFSVALDGSEDEFLGRAARDVWKACDMPTLRRQAIEQVNAALDAHVEKGVELSMSMWRSVVQHPRDPGITPEGFEFEGELLPGERPWIEPDEEAMAEEAGKEKALDEELLASDGALVAASAVEEVDPSSWAIEPL